MTDTEDKTPKAGDDLAARREEKIAADQVLRADCELTIAFVCPRCSGLDEAPIEEGAKEALYALVDWDEVVIIEPEDPA